MSKAQEIMKQLLDNEDYEAISSEENLRKALGERGCDPEEIDGLLAGFNGFPLDDDDLDAAAGVGRAWGGGRGWISEAGEGVKQKTEADPFYAEGSGYGGKRK